MPGNYFKQSGSMPKMGSELAKAQANNTGSMKVKNPHATTFGTNTKALENAQYNNPSKGTNPGALKKAQYNK